MLGPLDLLLGGVVPGLVALIARALLHRIGLRDAAWPVTIALAVVAGQASLGALTAVSQAESIGAGAAAYCAALPDALGAFVTPRQASAWLPGAAVVAAIVTLLLCRERRGARWTGIALGVALAIAMPTRLLWGSVYLLSEWSPGEAILRLAGLSLGLMTLGWLAAPRRRPDPAVARPSALVGPVLMAGVALGAAVLLATSGSLSYAQLAGVMVAAVVGATLGGVGQLPFSQLAAGADRAGLVVAAGIGGLAILGAFFAEVTMVNALLVATALGAAASTLRSGGAPAWRPVLASGAICVVAIGFAATTSGIEFARAIAQPVDNPYLNWQPPE